MERCKHCEEPLECEHGEEHPQYCCDCFDLSCGMPLDLLNRERAAKGKDPLKPLKRGDA